MAQDDFNFMDLLEDDAWFEAAARREESVTCEALAGNGRGTHLGAVMANPRSFSHFAQLRSMVVQAWQQLVTEWDLGVGKRAGWIWGECASRCLDSAGKSCGHAHPALYQSAGNP
ncbi:MAG: hypothetical protein AAGG53_10555 [Cyanobacteria bacterium P01_H01_bin.152]